MPQQQGASASASAAATPSWAGAGADLAFAAGELQAPSAALPGSVGPALPLWRWPALGADVLPGRDRPEALLSGEGPWQGLAVDAYLMGLARTSQTTGSALQDDTAPRPAYGLAPPPVPGGMDRALTPPAGGDGWPPSALARRAAHGPGDDWGMDILTPADLSGGGEAAT